MFIVLGFLQTSNSDAGDGNRVFQLTSPVIRRNEMKDDEKNKTGVERAILEMSADEDLTTTMGIKYIYA